MSQYLEQLADNKKHIQYLCVAVLILLLFNIYITIEFYYLKQRTPTIATADIESIVGNFIATSSKSDLDDEALGEAAVKFSKRLDQLTKIISERENIILLPTQVVLSDAPDLTRSLQNLLTTSSNQADVK